MRVPSSTYRLQFNRSFGFADARQVVPYLNDLGIGDLYASPLFAATPGSAHGYDVTDPTRLNPALGSRRGFIALAGDLSERGMGLLLDIVPNHMAATPDNPWWNDVLTHGPASVYARYFDIDWQRRRGRVLLPVLGDRIDHCIGRGEVTIEFGEAGFSIAYYDLRLPVDPATYADVLRKAEPGGAAAAIANAARAVPPRHPDARGERARAGRRLVRRLAREYRSSTEVRRTVDGAVARINASPARLGRLLGRQPYELRFWRSGSDHINYRRFFDITSLAGVRVEDGEVMETTHRLAAQLLTEGAVTGLRIDHVDGLRDPAAYLRDLQRLTAPPEGERRYVVVEKILVDEETLPPAWPVAGTTGYDFLRAVNDLFVDPAGLQALNRTYRRVTGNRASFDDVLYRQKKKIIRRLFQSEVSQLTDQMVPIAQELRPTRPPSGSDLRRAIIEMASAFPVYRTYITGRRVSRRDREVIRLAAARARRHGAPRPALKLLTGVLNRELQPDDRRSRAEALDFVMRFQQFTGPAMAKGQEDTAFYTYNPLRSLNEVGEEPSLPSDPLAAFHAHNEYIQRNWPATMTTTSTHDTKRSEDARARINVLSELAGEWDARVRRWREMNGRYRSRINGRPAPDANEEMLLYQALAGVWPLDPSDEGALPDRLKSFIVKAAREAKTNTSWRRPDPKHEQALQRFVEAVLRDSPRNRFRRDVLDFLQTVAYRGHINSLAQTLLKIAAPGVPDFYQGCETWSFTLVDPDNRRPVDFAFHRRMLAGLAQDEARDRSRLIDSMIEGWQDGRIKIYITWKGLTLRGEHSDLFIRGRYEPLFAGGRYRRRIVAFARSLGGRHALAVAPRLTASTLPPGVPPTGEGAWGGATLSLPRGMPRAWTNAFTGESIEAEGGRLRLADVLRRLPVALLTAD